MWNMKCFVIPVITGATEIVTKVLKEYLETIPGKHSINSPQKNSCTGNIAHNKERATVCKLKPEWWDAPLVQHEKYQREGNCDKI
jgi:hypothetical protein